MTTTVTIRACCDKSNKKVEVRVADRLGNVGFFMEDGEEVDCVVYDERAVTVREVEK